MSSEFKQFLSGLDLMGIANLMLEKQTLIGHMGVFPIFEDLSKITAIIYENAQ